MPRSAAVCRNGPSPPAATVTECPRAICAAASSSTERSAPPRTVAWSTCRMRSDTRRLRPEAGRIADHACLAGPCGRDGSSAHERQQPCVLRVQEVVIEHEVNGGECKDGYNHHTNQSLATAGCPADQDAPGDQGNADDHQRPDATEQAHGCGIL